MNIQIYLVSLRSLSCRISYCMHVRFAAVMLLRGRCLQSYHIIEYRTVQSHHVSFVPAVLLPVFHIDVLKFHFYQNIPFTIDICTWNHWNTRIRRYHFKPGLLWFERTLFIM